MISDNALYFLKRSYVKRYTYLYWCPPMLIGKFILIGIIVMITATIVIKEYISVTEETAPPCVFRTFAHPTSPPTCSVRQSGIVGVYCRQSKKRLGGQMFGRRRGVLSVRVE